MFIKPEEIVELTTHHPPKDLDTITAHEIVRSEVRALMMVLNDMLPDCPQKTHLIRQVLPLQVMSAANQIIAIHGVNNGSGHADDQFQPEGPRSTTD